MLFSHATSRPNGATTREFTCATAGNTLPTTDAKPNPNTVAITKPRKILRTPDARFTSKDFSTLLDLILTTFNVATYRKPSDFSPADNSLADDPSSYSPSIEMRVFSTPSPEHQRTNPNVRIIPVPPHKTTKSPP
jgi:hypothetical protein